MDAFILAGGLGTRLRPVVADRAKPVADVNGRPFLALVLDHLRRTPGLGRAVLCVGHLADTVEAALGAEFAGLPLDYSREPQALGTGGALRLALSRRRASPPALALNGDTVFGVRMASLLAAHRDEGADATLALARVPDVGRFGAVRLARNRVVGFAEKGGGGAGWINGGVYVLGKRALQDIARGPEAFSLERELLPRWAQEGRLAGFRSRAAFLDIGVPEDYAAARARFAANA